MGSQARSRCRFCTARWSRSSFGPPRIVFLISAAAVFSHWILDFLVHKPDLWIYDDVKVGLGLWRWMWISLPLELIFLFAGAWAFARYVPARRGGNVWLWIFVAAMSLVEIYGMFGSDPASPQAEATTALIAYGVLALLAGIVDLSREERRERSFRRCGSAPASRCRREDQPGFDEKIDRSVGRGAGREAAIAHEIDHGEKPAQNARGRHCRSCGAQIAAEQAPNGVSSAKHKRRDRNLQHAAQSAVQRPIHQELAKECS